MIPVDLKKKQFYFVHHANTIAWLHGCGRAIVWMWRHHVTDNVTIDNHDVDSRETSWTDKLPDTWRSQAAFPQACNTFDGRCMTLRLTPFVAPITGHNETYLTKHIWKYAVLLHSLVMRHSCILQHQVCTCRCISGIWDKLWRTL